MTRLYLYLITCCICLNGCSMKEQDKKSDFTVKVFQSSKAGDQLTLKDSGFIESENPIKLLLDSTTTYQKITGFGGSFTESTAYLLKQLSPEKRQEVIDAYFGDSGARYSLTRTHINSCDFSLSNYAYVSDEPDPELRTFSIAEDKDDIIPLIKDAQKVSSEGFNIIASPWTAPPWMKDNNSWVGGKLLPEYYQTWALYFSKYIAAFKDEGIDIWGITVENEPLGNGSNWESMHYSASEMTQFVDQYLGPQLEKDWNRSIKLLGYDQNRDHLKEWVDDMYDEENGSAYFDGTAIHWYASTFEVFPDVLDYAKRKAPDKFMIQTEACVDAEVPKWRDDQWYWSKEATDWGWDWASAEEKHLHPKYVPAYRYARDIIGCLNHWVDGWVDWNMVLDTKGGPNWFKNWCVAPVIVDPEKDEVYYTPLYYVLSHFSKFIRPGAFVIKTEITDSELMVTAAQNPDESIAIILFNPTSTPKSIELSGLGNNYNFSIEAEAIQTIQIMNN